MLSMIPQGQLIRLKDGWLALRSADFSFMRRL